MAKATKRKAPSRVRYEQSHPTVSCRVSKDIYDRLTQAKQADGKSFADILKQGLGIVQEGVKKQAEARKKGYDQGHMAGFAEAKARYLVTYLCSVCGKTIEVTTENEKAAISQLMTEKGWRHGTCVGK